MSQEEKLKKQQLEDARNNDQNEKQPANQPTEKPVRQKASARNLAKNIVSVASLTGYIEIRDVFFMFTIMMTLLKDIMDVGIIGTIMTPFTLIITLASMLVCGSNNFFGKRKATTLLLSSLFEFIPVINFLPAATLSSILIYVFILQERKDAHKK